MTDIAGQGDTTTGGSASLAADVSGAGPTTTGGRGALGAGLHGAGGTTTGGQGRIIGQPHRIVMLEYGVSYPYGHRLIRDDRMQYADAPLYPGRILSVPPRRVTLKVP